MNMLLSITSFSVPPPALSSELFITSPSFHFHLHEPYERHDITPRNTLNGLLDLISTNDNFLLFFCMTDSLFGTLSEKDIHWTLSVYCVYTSNNSNDVVITLPSTIDLRLTQEDTLVMPHVV